MTTIGGDFMDGLDGLLMIARKIGLGIPPGPVSLAFVTGRIMERLESGGPYSELAAAMVHKVGAVLACNEETSCPEECLSVLNTCHSNWERHLDNLKQYGTNDPKEIAKIEAERKSGE